MQGHKMCLCVIQTLTNSSLGNIVQVKEHFAYAFCFISPLCNWEEAEGNMEELSDGEAFLIKTKLYGVNHTRVSQNIIIFPKVLD